MHQVDGQIPSVDHDIQTARIHRHTVSRLDDLSTFIAGDFLLFVGLPDDRLYIFFLNRPVIVSRKDEQRFPASQHICERIALSCHSSRTSSVAGVQQIRRRKTCLRNKWNDA